MADAEYLSKHFLIAMPGLTDPNFFHTVTYICQHDAEGAMGIVINRPLDLSLADILSHMDIQPTAATAGLPIFQGGPVQPERGFVLHDQQGDWEATLRIGDEIDLTASQDVLAAIAAGRGPKRFLIALGFAGWGAGQLEREMAENAWLSGPASTTVLFDTPVENRWEASAALLGVDLNLLSGDTGHA